MVVYHDPQQGGRGPRGSTPMTPFLISRCNKFIRQNAPFRRRAPREFGPWLGVGWQQLSYRVRGGMGRRLDATRLTGWRGGVERVSETERMEGTDTKSPVRSGSSTGSVARGKAGWKMWTCKMPVGDGRMWMR